MKKQITGLLLISTVALAEGKHSALWQDFVEAKTQGRTPVLPDFSYAGYRYGETGIPDVVCSIFNIADYGAVADDEGSDREAIEAAIAAAEKNGSGIVFFPPGRFCINEERGNKNPIVISKGGIVLRGSGCGEGGTELFMKYPLEPLNPKQMWTVPYMFQFRQPLPAERDQRLTKITGAASRESFQVKVMDASRLKAGDRVSLRLIDPDATAEFLAPYKTETEWKKALAGDLVNERHCIASIDGNILTFTEPIHVDIDPKYNWELYSFVYMEGAGVEDLAFIGNWDEPFVHHKNALHDSGWSAVDMQRCVNSWIRRCRFANWNQCARMSQCVASSVLQCTIEGNPGHRAFASEGGSYGVLIGRCTDTAGQWHGPGASSQSAGAVIWRCEWPETSSIELHASFPRDTLFDSVDGGLLHGRFGGDVAALPNHLRHLVLWNYEQKGPAIQRFSFWWKGKNWGRVVMPIAAGFHGSPTTFIEEEFQVLESCGEPVLPESLYEAQLERRLGFLPEWIVQAKHQLNRGE